MRPPFPLPSPPLRGMRLNRSPKYERKIREFFFEASLEFGVFNRGGERVERGVVAERADFRGCLRTCYLLGVVVAEAAATRAGETSGRKRPSGPPDSCTEVVGCFNQQLHRPSRVHSPRFHFNPSPPPILPPSLPPPSRLHFSTVFLLFLPPPSPLSFLTSLTFDEEDVEESYLCTTKFFDSFLPYDPCIVCVTKGEEGEGRYCGEASQVKREWW